MLVKTTFELSMIVDSCKFEEIFDRCYCCEDYPEENDSEFVDYSLEEEGIVVRYRASQFKKKITLIVTAYEMTAGNTSFAEKFVRKLNKQISKYFNSEFQLNDFSVSKMIICKNIDVGNEKNLQEYLHVLRRVGKVKGFSPMECETLEEVDCFCLKGNSSAVNFLIYDLRPTIIAQMKNEGASKSQLQVMSQETEGVLRVEVHLTKPKAIQRYTDQYVAEDQIVDMVSKSTDIFMKVFTRVVPYGDFYKIGAATELIRKVVKEDVVKRRMLRLVALIPEKKSIHLAQKEMSYRHPEKLLIEFVNIGLSPVTLGKRQSVKYLKNLYQYLR